MPGLDPGNHVEAEAVKESWAKIASFDRDSGQVMPGLVVFLHGLMGNRHSWGAVPDFVQGPDFAVVTPTYNAKVRGRSDIETSAQRVVTELQTRYPNHEPIYLVGHSLGGLVAREICRRLLLQGPDTLTQQNSSGHYCWHSARGCKVWKCFASAHSFPVSKNPSNCNNRLRVRRLSRGHPSREAASR
jgi:hypothetical protein